MAASILWFRRDLRLSDNPALLAALDAGDPVVPLFVLDDRLLGPSGDARTTYLLRSLRALDDSLDGRLVVRHGDPVSVLADVAHEVEAASAHVAADYGPYGSARDDEVERSLADKGIPLVRTGSPYAVAPGRVRKPDGSAYSVFTPFSKAWVAHGWRAPAASPRSPRWADGVPSDPLPTEAGTTVALPEAGEAAAIERWRAFRDRALDSYKDDRNRPDLPGSSRMSVHLKYGEAHPRTLLADLGQSAGHLTYRSELCWREFYADVLHHQPATAREYYRPELARMAYSTDEALLRAWQEGRTGYPFVDAGMRQLLGEGWVHNRVRMVVASFLVKDLHQEWTVGARWFMRHLVDGDLASNSHGWQWVAGTGTDAAPYYRVFNPVLQGLRFDPDGDYVRRWVPELRGIDGAAVHEPWELPGGLPEGYPERVVLHDEERREALARYQAVKA